MCAECFEAAATLQWCGYGEADAMAILWHETCFPFGDGKTVMRQTVEFLTGHAPAPESAGTKEGTDGR